MAQFIDAQEVYAELDRAKAAKQHVDSKGDTTMTQTVKEAAWAAIEKAAADIRRRDPTVTIHKARDLVMQTDAGRAQLELYHHPDAHLSAAKFVERQEILAKRETGTGRQRWDQVVTDIAKAMAAKHGVKFHEGLQLVAKHHPAIYGEYLAEREGRGLLR